MPNLVQSIKDKLLNVARQQQLHNTTVQISNAMKIKYEFATVLFAQKTQKKCITPSGFNARYFNPNGVALL